jgi:hypothetical protein
MADPPSLPGVNEMEASVFPAVAAKPVGALAVVAGVTELLVAPTEFPMLFIATTVNVYAVPFVRPVNVMGDDEPVTVVVAGVVVIA